MPRLLTCLSATGLILLQVLLPLNVHGQGNLMITPKRVVFEGNRRTMEINLANTGEDTATYAISLIENRMTEDGNFEEITEPDEGQLFASPYLRYFPRSVILGPRESQTVKIQLNRTSGLASGEYRSHIYFRSVPGEKPLGEEEEVTDPSSITIKLVPIFGITIPVIFRIGEYAVKVTLSDLRLEMENDTVPKLTVFFNRSGNYSVYGDVVVDHIASNGRVTRVAFANGVAVYTPNPRRSLSLRLINTADIDPRSGKLRVTYSAPSDVKPQKYAEAELALQ